MHGSLLVLSVELNLQNLMLPQLVLKHILSIPPSYTLNG